MDYIVYIADECRKEAREHNYTDALEKHARDVEQNQYVGNFDKFPVPFFVKKQFAGKQSRLIAAQEIVTINNTDYAVLKFLAVLIKADKEYNDFQDRANVNGEKYLKRVDSETVKKYVEEKIAKEPPPKKQNLSDAENSFLYSSNATYSLDNEPLIYESGDWINAINSKPYSHYLSHIHEGVFDLVNGSNTGDHCISIKNQQNHTIIFYTDHEKKYLFLIGLCSADADIEGIFEQWKKRQETTDIVRLARRAYPQYLLGGDPESWFEIEKDLQSNYALSGEEINVLKSISEQNAFPLFINGRAGSGKSTILQYLFAEYFFRYLTYQDTVPPPVYFTYNSELLKKAKIFVTDILKKNSNYVEKIREKTDIDELNIKLDASFNELRKYLLSIAGDEARFQQDKYISYSVFIKLWHDKFKADKTAQKEYPADISWHVIRTYIEGISPDDYLEPEEYVGLEKDQKTVSPELYQKIYKTVWEWYRKLKEEQNLWDDQDLVRYIIENELATPRFSGIFCDESQDFTRIEMEVIYQLSIFSQRDIPLQFITKIPFAFVGDELQTINPTGFRWDAMTALFTEKFILSVYPDRSRLPAKPNFKELENNYRSTQNIVNFCNALQLFRANRFDIPNLLPQAPWENSDGPGVARFEPNSAVFWQGIREKPDSVVFIIPCNEGDEIEWIQNDPELSANMTISNGTLDFTVLSVNSAKGLEFELVVVWKFGSQNGLEKLLNQPKNEDAAGRLPLQYHINKTYVAISRAKRKLFILDDDTGINNLWRVTKDSGLINDYLSGVNKNQQKWDHGNLEIYTEGSDTDFSDNVIENQEEIAKQVMEMGLTGGYPLYLRRAARIFGNLKKNQQSAKCRGYAEIFDKNYFSAGEYFLNGGWTDEAVQAFLLANTIPDNIKGFEKILEISASQSRFTNSLFYHVAFSVCHTAPESVNELLDFLSTSASMQFDKFFPSEAMKTIIGDAFCKCLKQITGDRRISESLLEKTINAHQQKSVIVQPEIIAQAAFALSKYNIAVAYWGENPPGKDKRDYETALMQIKGFPDNISLLYKEKNYSKIVDEHRKFRGKLTDDALVMVIQALFFENEHDEGFIEIAKIHSDALFGKIIQECSSCLNSRERKVLSVCQRVSVIFNESWNKNLKFIGEIKDGSIGPLYAALALARTGLAFQSPAIQKPFSDFLEREFIRKFENVPEPLLFDIGTAIEKAGRIIDILKYYEMAIQRFSENEENRRICIERWILAKEKHAKHGGGKEKEKREQAAAEKRREYGIEGDIDDFIRLDEKSGVIKYIIDSEMSGEPDKPRQIKLKVKTPGRSQDTVQEQSVKQKTELDMEGYHLVYFMKTRRLNITSNTDGKTISLQHSEQKTDYISTGDYIVKSSNIDELGNCQKIEETPIYFSVTEDRITVFLENTKTVINFL